MDNRKCSMLVNGKECALEVILVEQEIETEMGIYECPLGHRTSVLLGAMEKSRCAALVDGRACGLALSMVERDLDTATGIYECPLGHRAYVPLETDAADSS